MGLELELYNISKRKNSTLLPDSPIATVGVVLKNGLNFLNPIFLLDKNNLYNFNYCKFQGRYYFVKNITSVRNDLSEVECVEDFLATWKTEILATPAHIIYETSGFSDVIDSRIPVESTPTWSDNSVALAGLTLSETGSFYISTTGINGCETYALSYGTLETIFNNISTWYDGNYPVSSFTDIGEAIRNFLQGMLFGGSATENVRDCYWLPFVTPSSAYSGSKEIVLGHYASGVNGYKISNPIVTQGFNISIPWQKSDWRNSNPYTQVYVYIPFIGTIPLTASSIKNASALRIEYGLNVLSGDFSIEIAEGTNILYTSSVNVKGEIPYGSSGFNGLTAIAKGIGTAVTASIKPEFAIAYAIAGGIDVIGDVNQGGGGLSGSASVALDKAVHCTTCLHDTVVNPSTYASVKGLPSGRCGLISSGYVQTDKFSVIGSMLDDERIEINSMLDGGIYVE